jgi:hypothetical protein
MNHPLLDAITALDGTERLIAFPNGLRVGYAHLGDQWLSFEETPSGGRGQMFHPDAFAAFNYLLTLGLGETPFRVIDP